MRPAALASIAVLIGACGTQSLEFDPADATPDSLTASDGCSSDGDCPLSGLHCDPSSRKCVACVTDDQCAGFGYGVCDVALNLCVECGVDGDCRGGTCEPTSHRCVSPCADGGNCPNSLFCNARTGVCSECAGDTCSTRSTPVCDPSVGQCVQCAQSEDCPLDRHICNRTTGRCVQCLNSDGCAAEQACDPYDHECRGTSVPDGGPSPAGPGVDAGRTPI